MHLAVSPDDEDHQHVAENTQHEDDDVERAEYCLHHHVRHNVLRVVVAARRRILHRKYHRRCRRYVRHFRVVNHSAF